jgi:hypothetical protein
MPTVRRKVTWALAAAASAVLLAGLAFTAPASASQSAIRIQNNTASLTGAGVSGYGFADDNQTHFRYTQTTVVATPQLVQLNGTLASTEGSVGTELCDPNIGYAAQVGLLWDPNGAALGVGSYRVFWAIGHFASIAFADPCSQAGFVKLLNNSGPHSSLACPTLFDCGSFNMAISQGDSVQLAIWYAPGHHLYLHQVSFSAADSNPVTGVARQAYSYGKYQLNFWEFGDGAVNNNAVLTAPALNPLDTFSNDVVTCYSCTVQAPLGNVQSVTGFGGLTEYNYVNSSAQTIMSPNGTLAPYPSAVKAFSLFNGSTSV